MKTYKQLHEQTGKSLLLYKEISNELRTIDHKVKKMANEQKHMKHPTDEYQYILSKLREISQMLSESAEHNLEESDYVTAKKRVQKLKRGTAVSFVDPTGTKREGVYKGLVNRGGMSYARVEMGKQGMSWVPVTQIEEQTLPEAKYDYADMVDWVADKMENTRMDVDEMRAAFIKKFGRNSRRYFEAAVDELM